MEHKESSSSSSLIQGNDASVFICFLHKEFIENCENSRNQSYIESCKILFSWQRYFVVLHFTIQCKIKLWYYLLVFSCLSMKLGSTLSSYKFFKLYFLWVVCSGLFDLICMYLDLGRLTSSNNERQRRTVPSVIVIGGGISGVAAANALSKASFEVMDWLFYEQSYSNMSFFLEMVNVSCYVGSAAGITWTTWWSDSYGLLFWLSSWHGSIMVTFHVPIISDLKLIIALHLVNACVNQLAISSSSASPNLND